MSFQRTSPPLFDTLKELNDLVKALQGKDFDVIITKLTTARSEAEEAKKASDVSTAKCEAAAKKLEKAARANAVIGASFISQRDSLALAKTDNKETLQKIKLAENELSASVERLNGRILAFEGTKAAVSKNFSDRENKLVEDRQYANALREEYENKLADLKKITG